MPPKPMLAIVFSVIIAGSLTIWLATTIATSLNPAANALVAAFPIVIVGLVLWRMINARQK